MVKFLVLVAILFGIAFGFHWLKETSGEVALTIGDTAYALDLTTAVVALIAVILVTMGLVWFLQELLRAPGRFALGWRRRNADRGRAAVSHGLIALAAGDLRAAERATAEAARRTPDLPLTRLLQAQTAQLKGDRVAARGVFQAMTEDPQTRIAGLRGLYVEAEREGEAEAARQIAEQAREESPSAAWAARALLRHQTAARDWDAALRTLSGAADGRLLDKRAARRQRAVLLAAKAMSLEEGEPDAARHAAIEAHDLAPDLVAAAVTAGRLLARHGDIRRATRVLEAAWKATPHPEIVEAYTHVRPGDSAADRLKRAETLHRLRPQADEGRLGVARAAIEARDFDRARDALTPVLTTRPTQNALIVMAELAERETGDSGRAREWIARAVHAPRDPAWTADGAVLEAWAPASPVTGHLDAVEWKVPVAELEGPRLEIDALEMRPKEPERTAELAPPGPAALSQIDPPARALEVDDDAPPPRVSGAVSAIPPWLPEEVLGADGVPNRAAAASSGVPPLGTAGQPPAAGHADNPTVASPDDFSAGDEDGEGRGSVQPLRPPIPDDPGVTDEESPAERPRRFGMF